MSDVPYKLEAGDITPFIRKNAFFRHYRNRQLYRIVSISRHTETQEILITYKAMYGEGHEWTRPYTMFAEQVDLDDGSKSPRFIPQFYQPASLNWFQRFAYWLFYKSCNKALANNRELLSFIRNHQDEWEVRSCSTQEILAGVRDRNVNTAVK